MQVPWLLIPTCVPPKFEGGRKRLRSGSMSRLCAWRDLSTNFRSNSHMEEVSLEAARLKLYENDRV